ncbi:LOW QUALITY PROTEIN: hypothetical protein U9M48_045019 [Paspalum notatum var. saurae]|uniref:Uncharacterized protein n=1 Tax=Paspalum notatum var. saurae TaxID=547442 RepID=A0AAQ3UW80_PASNO
MDRLTVEARGEAAGGEVVEDEQLLVLGVYPRRGTRLRCSAAAAAAASTHAANSRLAAATSRRRFTTTTVPSSSVALYDVPVAPFPSTSADARSRSSRSKLYCRNTSRLRSAAAAAARPISLDDDVKSPLGPISPDAVDGVSPRVGGVLSAAAFASPEEPRRRLRRRARHSRATRSATRNSAAAPAPTATATTAAPESLRLLLPLPSSEGLAHGRSRSGAPQRPAFPAKSSGGMLASEAGMGPSRSLKETLSVARPPRVGGIGPERRLASSLSERSLGSAPSSVGTAPESWFRESARCSSAASADTSGGMAPSARRRGSARTSGGTGPRRRLSRSESTWRPWRRESVPGVTPPARPIPGRCSSVTVALAASQRTPVQAQAGSREAFHPSARSCGVPDRNACSADTSCAGGPAPTDGSARSRRRRRSGGRAARSRGAAICAAKRRGKQSYAEAPSIVGVDGCARRRGTDDIARCAVVWGS